VFADVKAERAMAGEDKKDKGKQDAATAGPPKLNRRDVLIGLSTVPALGLFGYAWNRQRQYEQATREAAAPTPAAAADVQPINIALIGGGAQGQVLVDAMLRIPAVRFRAVCDIWTEYNQRRVVNTLKRFKHEVNGYEDYRQMLDKEKDIEAVVIATPDFWHAQHATDCLKAGKHVYCEKEMSNTLEGARAMVAAARETGKLLQIGHQRRSNPRYLHCYNKLLREANLLGRIVTVNGQWNRAVAPDLGAPDRYAIPEARLKQYGYKDMHQFRNWRWYKGLGGGPIVDLGSHQIDVYSWFLGANPSQVMASGGLLYHDPRTHEWYDTVMVVYDYATAQGPAKAYYQTQTTNGSLGYYESFMGDQGTLLISESEVNYAARLYRDPNAPAWDPWIQKGYLTAPKVQEMKEQEDSGAIADVRESVSPDEHTVPVVMRDPYHQPHLQNFFDAVRGKAALNCPPEVAYESAVTVLKVNQAIEARAPLSFSAEEFKV
jgi:predicted dehydrogenase